MATIKKAIYRQNYFAALFIVFIALALMVALTGCGGPSAVAADPKASNAAVEDEPAEVEPVEEPAPPVNNLIKQFGEVVTYDDNVSISVSAPTPFTPTNLDYFPLGEGETAVVFKVVLTNNSTEPLEPGALAQANSGGKPATYITDVGNPEYPDLGLFPTTTILPGQTLEWFTAFGVTNVEDITLEISPTSFVYDSAIFTNVAF